MQKPVVALAADHAGFDLKQHLLNWLPDQGYALHDCGTFSSESTDYPDHVHALARSLLQGKARFGVAICGSGNGVCMTANRHRGIRAALAWQPRLAQLARAHNNANVLCLPARFIFPDEAQEIVLAFLTADFEGGRHERRVAKIEPDYSPE